MSKVFRVDHVGSLVRPQPLLDGLDAFEHGRLDRSALLALQQAHVAALVARQETVGLPVVTDGEVQRRSYSRVFYEHVNGLEQQPGPFRFNNAEGPTVPVKAARVTSRLKRHSPIVAEDFRFLRSLAHGEAKATL